MQHRRRAPGEADERGRGDVPARRQRLLLNSQLQLSGQHSGWRGETLPSSAAHQQRRATAAPLLSSASRLPCVGGAAQQRAAAPAHGSPALVGTCACVWAAVVNGVEGMVCPWACPLCRRALLASHAHTHTHSFPHRQRTPGQRAMLLQRHGKGPRAAPAACEPIHCLLHLSALQGVDHNQEGHVTRIKDQASAGTPLLRRLKVQAAARGMCAGTRPGGFAACRACRGCEGGASCGEAARSTHHAGGICHMCSRQSAPLHLPPAPETALPAVS